MVASRYRVQFQASHAQSISAMRPGNEAGQGGRFPSTDGKCAVTSTEAPSKERQIGISEYPKWEEIRKWGKGGPRDEEKRLVFITLSLFVSPRARKRPVWRREGRVAVYILTLMYHICTAQQRAHRN